MFKRFIRKLLTKIQVMRINRMNLNQLFTKGQKLTNTETLQEFINRLVFLIQRDCPYDIVLNEKVYFLEYLDSLIQVAAVVPLSQSEHFIFFNTKAQVPTEIKEAIIAHEIGHISLGHVADLEKAEQLMKERIQCLVDHKVHQSEIDADAYACSIVGAEKVAKALQYLSDSELALELDKIELAQRIQIIQNSIPSGCL